MLTKGDILDNVKLRHEDVDVPEWGGTVRIQEMTAGAYDRYQSSLYTVKGKEVKSDLTHMATAYVQACLINEDGSLMFELKEIKELPAEIIKRLYDVAQRVNGEGEEGQAEIEKNSEGGQAE
jgi:hypothetical protein